MVGVGASSDVQLVPIDWTWLSLKLLPRGLAIQLAKSLRLLVMVL